jgi:predicted transcriptional regulator
MKLNDLFTRDVITAEPEEAVAGIARRMQDHNVGTIVIVEDRRPASSLTATWRWPSAPAASARRRRCER